MGRRKVSSTRGGIKNGGKIKKRGGMRDSDYDDEDYPRYY